MCFIGAVSSEDAGKIDIVAAAKAAVRVRHCFPRMRIYFSALTVADKRTLVGNRNSKIEIRN
jgi:hypothetical protein